MPTILIIRLNLFHLFQKLCLGEINIVEIPAVWCDIDFKQISANKIKEKSKTFPFKPSAIVHSGGGFHLCWIFDEPVTQIDIDQVEDVNRRIAGVLAGDLNSCDATRILRVPGSRNMKAGTQYHGAEVKVLRLESFRYELDDFIGLPEPTISENLPDRESIKKVSNTDINKCAFLQWCMENPAEVSEPLWYAMITNVSRIYPGGISLCHEISKGHPNYTSKETDQKILHAVDSSGPHTCAFIQKNGFDRCTSCGVKSPILRVKDQSRRIDYVYEDPFDS